MPLDARAIPDMLHWYEGMLLMPEHFQSASRRQEALSGYLAHIASPYAWGVGAIDSEIVEGVMRVRSLDAVMPDGLVVRYRSDDPNDAPLELDLKQHKPALEKQKKLGVHLVVIAWSEQAADQDSVDAGALARYRSVRGARLERDDPDAFDNGPAGDVMRERPWLRPILKLYVTDGPLILPPAKYVSLPLARVLQNAEGAIVEDRYEPPRTELTGAGEIHSCGRDVAIELRNRARLLNERLQRDPGLPDRNAGDAIPTIDMQLKLLARRFSALQHNVENLQALARSVPRIEALVKDRHTHPFSLYLALCDAVGDLAVLGGELNLPDIPAYAHADPLIAFDFLERHIFWILESLNQRFRVLAFERETAGRFVLPIKAGELGSRFVIGAFRAKGAPATPVVDWMKKAVIATGDQVADLKRRRVSGAARNPVDQIEELDLVAPAMTSLFRVEAGEDGIDSTDSMLVVENNTGEGPMAVLLYQPRDGADAEPASPEP